mgnify:CR=1 FL=1
MNSPTKKLSNLAMKGFNVIKNNKSFEIECPMILMHGALKDKKKFGMSSIRQQRSLEEFYFDRDGEPGMKNVPYL